MSFICIYKAKTASNVRRFLHNFTENSYSQKVFIYSGMSICQTLCQTFYLFKQCYMCYMLKKSKQIKKYSIKYNFLSLVLLKDPDLLK